MTQFLEVLRPGQTVLGMAHRFAGGEDWDFLRASSVEGVVVGVIDTMILIRDIRHSVQKARPLTLLMEAVRFGGLKLFTSTTVRDEVWEKLAIEEITTQLKINPDEAKQRWEQYYLPWITFLDPTELPLLSAKVRALQKRDSDDVPTGQIIELLRPDVVFCDDKKHLGNFDIMANDWFAAVVAYYATSKRAGVVASLHVGGALAFQGTIAVVEVSFSSLSKVDKEVWQGILTAVVIILALLVIAYSIPPSRRWLQQKAQSIVSFSKSCVKGAREYVGGIVDEVGKVEEASIKAKQDLSEMKQRAITPPGKVLEYAAMVLARTPGPLRTSEIVRRMKAYGYETSAEHPERYLSRVLHGHPRLFEKKDRGWSFRSHTAALMSE